MQYTHSLRFSPNKKQGQSRIPANWASVRPFLKEGKENGLCSYFLKYCDLGVFHVTPGMIREEISQHTNMDRTAITRKLERMCKRRDYPWFTIEEVGTPQQGKAGRYWVVTYKEDIPDHIIAYIKQLDDLPIKRSKYNPLKDQIALSYGWENDCLSNDPEQRRMSGKDLARRTGYKLRAVRYAQQDLLKEGSTQQEVVREEYERRRFRYVNGEKTPEVKEILIRNRERTVYRTVTKNAEEQFSERALGGKSPHAVGVIFGRQKKVVQNCTPIMKYSSPVQRTYKIVGDVSTLSTEEESKDYHPPSQISLNQKYQNAWEGYKGSFKVQPRESLGRTLGGMLKHRISFAKPEVVEKALRIAKESDYLKLASRLGWVEAKRALRVQRGQEIWEGKGNRDKEKYGDNVYKGPNLLWFLKPANCQKIISGKYTNREAGWDSAVRERASDGSYRQAPIPETFAQSYIDGLPCCSRESAIRGQLLVAYGILAYEHWFDKAGMDVRADGTWALRARDAWTAKTIGSKFPRVDVEVEPAHQVKKPGKGLRQSYSQHLAALEATANGSLAEAEDTLAQGPDHTST